MSATDFAKITTTVVWREWYNAASVEQLTKMGTLPRNEIELDTRWMDGEEVAKAIAEEAYRNDFESFREGGEIVIVEPEQFAGTYRIVTEYVPEFSAYEDDIE